MRQELPNQLVAIPICLGKQQNPGSEPVDTMDHEASLPLQAERFVEQGPGGCRPGAWNRHRWKAGRLIENHHRVVLVEHPDFR
jgi:hypothetical protein